MQWNFDYGHAEIREFQVTATRDTRTQKATATKIEIGGRQVTPTRRFWRSLFMRFGIGEAVFRYFDHAEVFQRISERNADDRIRYCIAADQNDNAKLLAVSNPRRPLITYDEVSDLLGKHGAADVKYHDGLVTSTHTPRGGERPFAIGGDEFGQRFMMETPIDGFSQPRIFLSMLRQVCSNGAIGYGRAFRSDISLGKDIGLCISRALDSFDNEEGYAALRQRFESAQTSWASVRECREMTKLLEKTGLISGATHDHLRRQFHRMSGNLHQLYGLANLDALSTKRQRVLPSRCRVYDLLNFASEVATHHTSLAGGRSLQALIGTMISDEYDMEGTAASGQEFVDLFMETPDAGPRVCAN